MSQDVWSAVDSYLCDALIAPDESLSLALRDSDAAGLPQHNVAPNQGKLLYLLAKMRNARRILEIGTLGGYSTIWLARALPGGGPSHSPHLRGLLRFDGCVRSHPLNQFLNL